MIAVGYSLIGLAAFAVGVTAGIRAERDRQSTNRADDLADKYRQGYRDGQIRGYGDGYSIGRADLIGEEQAKAIHPTAFDRGAEVVYLTDRLSEYLHGGHFTDDPDVA
jgi:hypothetical protein